MGKKRRKKLRKRGWKVLDSIIDAFIDELEK